MGRFDWFVSLRPRKSNRSAMPVSLPLKKMGRSNSGADQLQSFHFCNMPRTVGASLFAVVLLIVINRNTPSQQTTLTEPHSLIAT